MRTVLSILTVILLTAAAARGAEAARPNIVLVTADDLGLQLGCYGDRRVHTPRIDQFAERAVRFDRAFVAQSSCSSSRSSILTGLYPHQNGQIGLAHLGYSMKSDRLPTLPGLLKQAGYRTGIIGKLHVAPESAFPFDFRQTSAPKSREADWVEGHVRDFLAQGGDEPFFLYLNFFDPHGPYLRDVEGRPRVKAKADDMVPFPFIKGEAPKPEAVANFYTCINRCDELFGIAMDVLAEKGLADDAIVVLLGDNGPPFRGAKSTCYEAGLQVPLLVRWPGHHKDGTACNAMVSMVDLMPTLLEAAGVSAAEGLAGRSLAPLLGGDSAGWRRTLAAEFTTHEPNDFNPLRSIRDDRYKLILGLLHDPAVDALGSIDGVPLAQGFRRYGLNQRVELYDLEKDPWETVNLADDPSYREVRQRLERALTDWRHATADPLLASDALVALTVEQYRAGKVYVPKAARAPTPPKKAPAAQ